MSVKIFGVNKAIGYLGARGKAVNSGVKDAITQATLYVEGQVKDSVSGRNAEPRSVDTGRFLGSITSNTRGDTGVVSSNVEYASVLEYGSSKRVARKHFGNTLARSKDKVQSFIRDKVKKATKL